MKLFYREEGSGDPVIILHGLFGMSDNWLSLARKMKDKYKVVLPDLRNHGNSPHDEEWHYSAMVQDLHELTEALGERSFFLVGHSMGGKVAMKFAQTYPDLVKKLVVVDIAPRYYPVHHQTILKALYSVDIGKLSSRNDAEEQLEEYINEWGTRQFLLKNLGRGKEGFYWKFNLDVISKKIENVGEAINTSSSEVPTLFIRGSKSDYINDDDSKEIKKLFPNSFVLTIKNAGHWVHADQPEALLSTLTQYFER